MSAANLDPTLRALVEYDVQLLSRERLADRNSTLDVSKAPDSVQCGKCKQFLINPYKGLCCDVVVCESCKLFFVYLCTLPNFSRLRLIQQRMS